MRPDRPLFYWRVYMSTIQILLTVFAGIIGSNVIAEIIRQKGETKRQKDKQKHEDTKSESEDMKAVKTALKWVMYDRIRYLGQSYLAEGKIDFDDRRILREMHDSYHNGLGGNGDLDDLMSQVGRLPLK